MSPIKSPNVKEKPHICIQYESTEEPGDTPIKHSNTETYMPNYAMLQAKKAIVFADSLSRENSSDSLIEEKHKKDLFFKVDNIKFDELYDWANENIQKLKYGGEKPKTGTVVKCNNRKLALFRYDNEVFAIDEKCPHLGGPLHLGDIESVGEADILCVVCPWHKWRIELTSGRLKVPRGRGIRNEVYPTKIDEDGTVSVGFSEIDNQYFNGGEDF